MAKIQSSKKIVVEDFPAEARTLLTKLAYIMNPFIDQVVTALSKKLTLADNFKGKTYDLILAEGVSSIAVAWEYNEKPTSVTIGNLTKRNGNAPSDVFSMSSYHSDRKITLTFQGLDPAFSHDVTVVAQI